MIARIKKNDDKKNYIQTLVDKNMGLKVYDEFQAPVLSLTCTVVDLPCFVKCAYVCVWIL